MKIFSTKSSRAAGNRHAARKVSALAIAIILLIVIGIGGSVAYLASIADKPVTNSFTPGEIKTEIDEGFNDDNTVKTSVIVNNTGNTSAYIRVAVVANAIDEDDNITGAADVSDKLKGSDWTKLGDYYYYNGIVQAGGETSNLLNDEGIDLTGIQVTVLASAIQVEPADAVIEAWGVQFNNGAWTTASGT